MPRADVICRKGYLLPHCLESERDQEVRLYWDRVGKRWSVTVAGILVTEALADQLIDAAIDKHAIASTPEDS
jgi:hypothetical protein